MPELTLPDHPTLPDLQAHIKAICAERGWDNNTPEQIFLLLTEEVGELAKATRKEIKLYGEAAKPDRFHLEEEFADVLNYLMDLANHFGVDLETAYRKKHAYNAERVWEGDKEKTSPDESAEG